MNRRRDPALEQQFPRVKFVHCDVRDLESIRRYFREAAGSNELPSLYFLSAGINKVDNVGGFSIDTFREVMEINLMGVMNFVSSALPYLTGREGVFVAASSTSNIFPNPNCLGYYVSKLTLYEIFKKMDQIYRKRGIRFKTLVLGPIATNIFVSGQLASKTQSAVREAITVRVEEAVPVIARFLHSGRQVLYYPKRACALFHTLRIVNSLLPLYKGSAPPAKPSSPNPRA